MEYRSIKICTPNRETCIAVQKHLFANGCTWHNGATDTQNTHAKFLYVSAKGEIMWGSAEDFFKDPRQSGEYKEVTFETEQTLTVKSMALKERPKTLLFGKMYYSDELTARLAGLEVAS